MRRIIAVVLLFCLLMGHASAVDAEKRNEIMDNRIVLNYPVFDGEKVWGHASVVIENGVITEVTALDESSADSRYFLTPALIDSHTHMGTLDRVETMLKYGITATCDVSASAELIAASDQLMIHSSAGMAMGVVLGGKGYVDKAAHGVVTASYAGKGRYQLLTVE